MRNYVRNRYRRFLYWTGIRKRPTITVRLSVDTSKFKRDLEQAQEAVQRFARGGPVHRQPES